MKPLAHVMQQVKLNQLPVMFRMQRVPEPKNVLRQKTPTDSRSDSEVSSSDSSDEACKKVEGELIKLGGKIVDQTFGE
eukprot:211647-Amphidinium_carterae.1